VSFEVYLQCFGESERSGISRAAARRLFPVVEEESEPDYWRIQYDPKNSCDIGVTALGSDQAMLVSLCIHRPCADLRLWEGLFAVLRMGSVVVLWPGSPAIVFGDTIGANLPKDMIGSIGPPRSVHSAAEILRLLRES
jgi:hypothetical protein